MFAARCGTNLLRSRATLVASPTTSSSIFTRTYALTRTLATESLTSRKPTEISDAFKQMETRFKTYKPITPSIRHLKMPMSPYLYRGGPVRQLTAPLRKKGGRNHHGRITIRFRGGGHKRRIRILDFMRTEPGPHDVVRIEYDPGRSAHIALLRSRVQSATGTKLWSYILAPEGLRAGDVVESFRQGIPAGRIPGFVDSKSLRGKALETGDTQLTGGATLSLGVLRTETLKVGNVLPLRLIPTGTIVHSLNLKPDGRSMLVRSAGTFATLLAHEDDGKYSHVRLQSGEVRKVLQDCVATIGKVSNGLWKNRNLGKAGRNRWLGRRPRVRGMAMNRCDHPHGGGRGKSKGNKQPRSVWGWLCKGKRTRKPGPKGHKNGNKMVVLERPRGKQKRG
ncbi:mitochondrial ribosomal protein subunit L2 [Cytidiella melzeri]|nr:mitochondrial ribosomal protein subunit L2 [Cytidiella melzeri]